MKTEENDYENHKKREEDPYTKSESIYYLLYYKIRIQRGIKIRKRGRKIQKGVWRFKKGYEDPKRGMKIQKRVWRFRQKKRRSVWKSPKWSLGPYDQIESCREWKDQSSHMCNDSIFHFFSKNKYENEKRVGRSKKWWEDPKKGRKSFLYFSSNVSTIL